MIFFKLVVIVNIMLFHFSIIAQTSDSNNSKEIDNRKGLIFENELEERWEGNSYTDVIQLFGVSDKAQAIQFRLLINKANDDSAILIFRDVQKGSDLSDPAWLLEYNVIKGPVASNGASQDEIYVVLYNSNLDGGLSPGDHSDLIKVNYQVADLPDLQNDTKSSIQIAHTVASTFQGVAIDITPTRDELKIYLKGK